jgi:hypothetical protein
MGISISEAPRIERMLGFRGPAQPSPTLGDALNAGYLYLEVRCLGCDTHQTVALDVVRRPKATLIHELERYMRCKDCSQGRGYAYTLRQRKITASDPPSMAGRTVKLGAQQGRRGAELSSMGSVRTFGDRVANTAGDESASAFGGIADLTGIAALATRSRMTQAV